MPLTLRDYQEECVRAHYDFFARHDEGHPLIVVPTGGGKSLIIAEFVKRSLDAWPKTRVLVVTHVKELIRQNREEFEGHVGATPWSLGQRLVGTYSAGLGERSTDCSVLFAGIQSIYNRAPELGHFDLVLIDEAHLVPKKGMGRYRHYLDELRKINPAVRVVGYTATHFRLDGGFLHRGEGRIFTDVAYDVDLRTLIDGGYLVALSTKKPEHVIDVSGVGVASGDFKQAELEEAARAEGRVAAAVAETVRVGRAANRKVWLFFAAGIKHAQDIVAELDVHGVHAEAVFGSTPKDDRDDVVARFKDGQLPALVNVGVLTTGFNAPRCDLMAVLRPTKSAALYVQIMGRGMRTFPGKDDCLVLDFGGNVERHGPINRVRPKHERVDGTEKPPPPMKVCGQCRELVPLGTKYCPCCGFEWPPAELAIEHERVASWEAPIDWAANKPRLMAVSSWHFREHEKENRPPSLRVDFLCGMRTITDWVCLEHDGFASRKARRWWLTYSLEPFKAPPDTVAEALRRTGELRMPPAIEVVDDGDYERVKRPIFEEAQEAT